MTTKAIETMPEGTDMMQKLFAHTLTLTRETAQDVDVEALWAGMVRFVHAPEKYNEQIQSSRVTAGAGDRPGTVFERVLDFGSHCVNETVYLNKAMFLMQFHVRETKEYPASILKIEITRSEDELPAVTFSYYASEPPRVPASLRPLVEKAWEEKDKDLLKKIILETLEGL